MANRVQIIFDALNRTKGATKEVEGDIKGIGAAAASSRVALLSMAATAGLVLGAMVREVFSVATEFQGLEASLITVTGSQAEANAEFERLQTFASETPYQLNEVVKAFIKLKALGLDPSSEALRSYGNTAAAMNKSLDQMIEAVADAATGEFERLKEFGIRASQQGEQVTFTFRGVKTTVRKEAAEIEGYLRKLGEEEFAGGMQRQMATLGGATSNLKDEWTLLVNTIGSGGLADAMESAVRGATSALRELRGLFAGMTAVSGWLQGVAVLEGPAERIATARAELGKYQQSLRDAQALLSILPDGSSRRAEAEAEIARLQRLISMAERNVQRQTDLFGKPAPSGSTGSSVVPAGETEEQRKAREKLAKEWEKTQAALSLDTEKLGLNSFDAKIADINAKATELRQKFGDLEKIELWRAAQVGAVDLERDMVAVRDEIKELEKGTDGALESFQGFVRELETTGGVIGSITEGLRLYGDEADAAAGKVDDLGDRAGITFAEMENAVEGWASGFSGQLNDLFWSADLTFSAILESFGRMLSQMVIQKQIVEPLLQTGMPAVGEFFSGLFGPGNSGGGGFTPTLDTGKFTVRHDGGPIVPRFHFGGLLPDEVPAILQTGERVLSREQNHTFDRLAALLDGGGGSGGGGAPIIQVITPPGATARTEQRQQGGQNITQVIVEAVKGALTTGQLDRAMSSNYGITRAGRK